MCQEHGTFLQTPSNHLRGKGCPKCGNLNRGKSNRSNKDAFILKANEKHDNKYDYTLVDYKRLKTHITIICPEHGNFIQSPDNHLQGAGCSKCGRKRTEDGHRLTTEEFVSKAKKIHTCDKYNYTQVDYKGAKIKVTIICPEHGKFEQTPTGHLSGKGCSECAIKKNSDNQRGTKESSAGTFMLSYVFTSSFLFSLALPGFSFLSSFFFLLSSFFFPPPISFKRTQCLHNIRQALTKLGDRASMPVDHLFGEEKILQGKTVVLVPLLLQIRKAYGHNLKKKKSSLY